MELLPADFRTKSPKVNNNREKGVEGIEWNENMLRSFRIL